MMNFKLIRYLKIILSESKFVLDFVMQNIKFLVYINQKNITEEDNDNGL